jgi:hypothetical protein
VTAALTLWRLYDRVAGHAGRSAVSAAG